MLEPLTKEALKSKIISLLSKDDRTIGHMADINDAMRIVESIGFRLCNWQLSMDTQVALPKPVMEAVLAAEELAKERWGLAVPPLGSSAYAMD